MWDLHWNLIALPSRWFTRRPHFILVANSLQRISMWKPRKSPFLTTGKNTTFSHCFTHKIVGLLFLVSIFFIEAFANQSEYLSLLREDSRFIISSIFSPARFQQVFWSKVYWPLFVKKRRASAPREFLLSFRSFFSDHAASRFCMNGIHSIPISFLRPSLKRVLSFPFALSLLFLLCPSFSETVKLSAFLLY